MEILRDPIWQFVGAAVAIVALLLAVFVPFLLRTRKDLSFELIASAPMLNIAARVREKVRISFLDRRVSDIHFVCIKITNSGNCPITRTDFEEELSFTFGSSTEVLDVELALKIPASLDVQIYRRTDGFSVARTLWNPDDSICVNILLNNFDGRIHVNGRIIGVQKIRESPSFLEKKSRSSLNRGLTTSALGWGILIGSFSGALRGASMLPFILGGVIAAIGILIIVFSFERDKLNMTEMIKANGWDKLVIVTPTKVFIPKTTVEEARKAKKRLRR